MHLAHVNSYCRGQIEDPTAEVHRSLAALASAPATTSDSYLSLANGAEAGWKDDPPESGVVRTCLRLGGYEETRAGLERAILEGWGRVQARELDREVGFLGAQQGLDFFRHAGTHVGISFPVSIRRPRFSRWLSLVAATADSRSAPLGATAARSRATPPCSRPSLSSRAAS